jgi:heme-degrading monooxygenase HmoA
MTEAIFFNLWQTDSRENQEALVAEMRSKAAAFRCKPGFLGLSVWTGQDDHRVIVEGRWRSQAHFEAAVSESPEAIASRARLEKFGNAEPGFAPTLCQTATSTKSPTCSCPTVSKPCLKM